MEQAQERGDLFKDYRREYKKRFAKMKVGRIVPEDFYAWSEEARKQKTACKEGKLSLDEFRVWLERS